MSETPMPWPAKGNQAFIGNMHSRVEAFLEGMEDFYDNDGVLADAFRQAGDAAVESAIRDSTRYMPTRLLLPIAYLYRHSMELQMKSMVADAIKRGVVSDDDNAREVLAGHNLHKLWNRARCVIEKLWPDEDPAPIVAAEKIILEFHRTDPSGQVFRYAYDKRDQNRCHIDTIPKRIDLANLREVADGVIIFLGCASSRLYDMDNGY